MDSLSTVMQALLDRVDDLTWWQAAIRAGIIFLVTWGLLRLAGRRAFAQKTSFDLCIVLLLGAVLSRAVVGANSMPVAIGASVVLVVLHRAVAWLSCRYPAFDRFAVGHAMDIFRHGTLDRALQRHAMISEEDLHANLRATLQAESLEDIERGVLERDGHLTFVRVKHEARQRDSTASRSSPAAEASPSATEGCASREPSRGSVTRLPSP